MTSIKSLFILIALALMTSTAFSSPEPTDAKKQTPWKLYVDSKEAYEMKQKMGEQVLFIDVRDPIEIMFTGFTDVVDINIPFKTANHNAWHKKKPVFSMETNPDFEKTIAATLKEKGLSKDTPIILMCRSGGTRGAPSAQKLWGKGYTKVYVVTDGFEGGKIKSGEKKNWRLVNGWKNSNLPWSYKLNKEKVFFNK